MVTKSDFKSNMRKLLTEFLGTMILLLSIQLACGARVAADGVAPPDPLAALAVGVIVSALIYSFGAISGCHINPALSLAFFLRGSMPVVDVLTYWVAQFGGGFVGALVGRILAGRGKSVTFAVGASHNVLQAFLAELIFTAFFILVILQVVPKSGKPETHAAATIGMTLFACCVATGSISGASINPAVALSLILVKNALEFHYAVIVVAANALGGILATFIWYLLDSGDEQLHPNDILIELRDKMLQLKTTGTDAETAPLVTPIA